MSVGCKYEVLPCCGCDRICVIVNVNVSTRVYIDKTRPGVCSCPALTCWVVGEAMVGVLQQVMLRV